MIFRQYNMVVSPKAHLISLANERSNWPLFFKVEENYIYLGSRRYLQQPDLRFPLIELENLTGASRSRLPLRFPEHEQ